MTVTPAAKPIGPQCRIACVAWRTSVQQDDPTVTEPTGEAEPTRSNSSGAIGGVGRMALLTKDFPRRGRGFWFGMAIDVIWPFLVLFSSLRMRGREHLPRTGGMLVASNHLSFADPITVTPFCLASGRVPRYLAKASLWTLPVIGKVMATGRHIPVHRGTSKAGHAFRDAVTAAQAGECVIFFPEAGFSRRDDGWPSAGKNGVARVALETGVPVIPLANWGTHHLLPATAKFPHLFPRPKIELVAGPPVDLSDLMGAELTRSVLDQATKRIMAAVTDLLAEVRGETPPAETPPAETVPAETVPAQTLPAE